MKHKKNKALKKYLHDVKKDCHGNYKSKKLFIEQLKDSLTTYTEENTDYTYEEVITLEKTEGWKEYNITFDLPDIIQKNPGKSFEKCAIFFNIVPEIDSAQKTLKTLVNLDDISLTETK